jgi:long-chain fatty acid transport protein
MSTRRPLASLTVTAVLALPITAQASGFLLYEQSAPALAKGGAVVAATADPSAVWFNPAAVAYLPRYGAAVSTALVFPKTRFSPAAGGPDTRSESRLGVVPSIFVHGAVTERVGIGLGLLAPFGLYVKWPDDWEGRLGSLKTDLKVLMVNPNVAVRLHDKVSVALGASPIRGLVALSLGLGPPPDAGRGDLEGDAWGWQVNVATLFRAVPERLHLGLTYRSRTRLAFEGDAHFTGAPLGLQEVFADQAVKATVVLPDVFAAGVMWRPIPRLELDAEVDWVLWSAFEELRIDFQNPGSATLDRRIKRSAVRPLTGRLGAEWSWPALALCARAGVSYDQSASTRDTLAPSAPDANRLGLATGLGYRRGRFTVDVAYLYAHFFAATAAGANAQPEGTYRTRAHVIDIMLGVRAP